MAKRFAQGSPKFLPLKDPLGLQNKDLINERKRRKGRIGGREDRREEG
jgi:hypothetical protein